MSALYSCLKGKNDTIMATKTTEGIQNLETEELHEECSATAKKKSKFKAFKKFFVKNKDRRKEVPVLLRENILKPSQSSSDVSITGASSSILHSAQDAGTKSNMGNKALSHDSVFIAEAENAPKEPSLHENAPGKVKALQLQLQQNIRMRSSPKIIARKKIEDSGTLSEDDGLPRSPPEMTTLHEILSHPSEKSSNLGQRRSSLSLGGTDSEDEQPISPLQFSGVSRPNTPANLLLPVDFSSPASPLVCLDNSAAKHRIAVKPKKQRGPALKLKQTDEEQCKDTVKTDEDVTKKEDKSKEDAVVQSLELDVTVQVESEIEEIKEDHGEYTPPVVSVTLIPEDEQCIPQDELTCGETDVDIHSNLVPSEDQAEDHCKETDKQAQNSPCSDPEVFLHLYVQSNITAVCDNPEILNNTNIETSDIVESDIQCDSTNISQENDECTETISLVETIGAEVKDDEQGECSDLDIFLLATEDEAQINMESTLIVEDLNLPAADLLPDTLATDACNSNKAAETEDETSPSITMSETLDTATKDMATMFETEISLAEEEDKCITTDKAMFNLNAQHTVLEAENAGQTILEEDNRINQTSYECEEESLPLDSPEKVFTDGKPNARHSESPQKTSTKPVLFTVVPAWQRSLSVGSTVKDSSFFRNINVHNIKTELFVGSASVPDSFSSEESKKENVQMIKSIEAEAAVPFGVRLRRTTSSLKYNEEEQVGESIQQSLCSSEPTLVVSQNIQNPAKKTETLSDMSVSKLSQASEDRWQQKTKPEDLSQRQNSEPAWISMAKQKQKGFQDHVLAREQSMETEEMSELLVRRNVTSLQSPELKENNIEPVSSDIAVLADVRLDLEKSTSPTGSQTSQEPPWLSLAKKKAKAWSEMPQIVQ
ncbi:uncharacterized protein LOC108700135 isoform X2 [Xenopus laevis]|uniref:DUF4592 domain-containing protein n=2 Tax=Xenopus laevis TaxID=8355 RepID=A0A974C3D9_XENLA|nr:uncharacterized protein LOC108700135 isoform X2 [Xenopus laevis]OCT65954.1 hypothetical protein XELAEV_18042208mg [Xenopus laevis]